MNRTPRTLADAFGPYCSRDVQPMHDNRASRVASVLLAVFVGVMGALCLVHWAAGG